MKTIRIACETKDSLALENLQPFQGELKSLSKEDYTRLKKEILETGFAFPIYVWQSPENVFFIIGGHQRLRALQEMNKEGFEIPFIPIVKIHADNFQQAKRRILQDVSQYGKVESQGLYEFMHEVDMPFNDLADSFRIPDINIEDFKSEYFEDLFEEKCDEDEIPEVPESFVKLGDIWLLGNHRLLCGDATKQADIDKLMAGEKAEMVFTDPPYGLGGYGGRNNMRLEGDDKDPAIFYQTIQKAPEMYVWGYFWTFPLLNFKPRDAIIWKKNNFGLGRGYRGQYEVCFYQGNFDKSDSDVWEISRDTQYSHPTQKPVALAERAINNSKPQLVLDSYLGSGSTLIACEKTGCKCYGMEIDPHYCGIIIERWQKYTGKMASKIT